jgi:hypothetical protein
VSPYPPLYPTISPLPVSTSHSTVCWFCVTISNAVFKNLSSDPHYVTVYPLVFSVTLSTAAFYSLPALCHYLILYVLLFLRHNVRWCLLPSVHCLSIPHTVPSVGFVWLYPLLTSKVDPLSLNTSHCTLGCFVVTLSTAVFYIISNICQYITM